MAFLSKTATTNAELKLKETANYGAVITAGKKKATTSPNQMIQRILLVFVVLSFGLFIVYELGAGVLGGGLEMKNHHLRGSGSVNGDMGNPSLSVPGEVLEKGKVLGLTKEQEQTKEVNEVRDSAHSIQDQRRALKKKAEESSEEANRETAEEGKKKEEIRENRIAAGLPAVETDFAKRMRLDGEAAELKNSSH